MSFRKIINAYQKALNRRPYLIQAVQTGALMGSGDIISQTLIEKKTIHELDYRRTLNFSSIGLFVAGPALRMWYGVLDKFIGSGGKTVVLKKVFVDQFVFAPTFLVIFLGLIAKLQGKSWDSMKQDIERNYFDILKTNYSVWPFVQLVNFYYVPLQYQVLLVQIVALFWNTYLSWKTNKVDHDAIKVSK